MTTTSMAQERSDKIIGWKEISAQAGYILSNDLHYNKKCSKIWTKQIREFKKQNPHIKDPNIIEINQKIKVQECQLPKEIIEVKKVEEIKVTQELPIKKEKKYFINTFYGMSLVDRIFPDEIGNGGYNIGFKIGRINNGFFYSIGHLLNRNNVNEKNQYLLNLGVFEDYEKFHLETKIELGYGDDFTLIDKKRKMNYSLYLSPFWKMTKDLYLGLDLGHGLDRFNIFLNVGLRIKF